MKLVENKKVYSVSEVNYFARQVLEELVFWVEGEVTSCNKSPGYNFFYLTLRDEFANLSCIADGAVFESLTGDLVGQSILAWGYLTLYEPRGQYQLKINRIEYFGDGLLQKKLIEVVAKLKQEGLFDNKHKKELPQFPRKICVVTSYGSDAWNDFRRHSIDNFPLIELYVADVRVQGTKSVGQLLKILPQIDEYNFDLIVIIRGGGSLEDLAAFNHEEVAREIFKMRTPTLVAIGHESNESLSEWVADRRASTPTDAAKIVTEGYNNLSMTLSQNRLRLRSFANYLFSTYFQRLDYSYYSLGKVKKIMTKTYQEVAIMGETLKFRKKGLIDDRLDEADRTFEEIKNRGRRFFLEKQEKLSKLIKFLQLQSIEKVMARGFSITYNLDGSIVKSVRSISIGGDVDIRLSDGKFLSTVISKSNSYGQSK